ncbi:flagellar hook protein FlgE [Herbaspirillum sp. SJZ107]|uniref:flagellar hook protein FlgE n=1 Tax=Herbaspirillum sp. SJZ107 TaxID=2572881 RepID=UPI0011515D2F|nr:flagellar hook protein FlgE [Herbaspirillum sp. SJZ107]TQK07506.1 flagellar hook protein FlgE [Herbaspirillum sp. SJZ107]
MSFQQGLSGLNGAAKSLDVIGNNIANSSTVGFKGSTTQFADVYARSLNGAGGNQAGIGVAVAGIAQQFTQGNIETSNNPLDIAINGAGFFRTQSSGLTQYTRNGQFSLDKNGFIVTPQGANLTGYGVGNGGQILAGTPQPLQINTADIKPVATTKVDTSINLDSRESPPANFPFSATDPTTYNKQVPIDVYDTLGNAHVMSMYYVKNAETGSWDVYVGSDGTEMTNTDVAGASQADPTAVAARAGWTAATKAVPADAAAVSSALADYASKSADAVVAAATAAGASQATLDAIRAAATSAGGTPGYTPEKVDADIAAAVQVPSVPVGTLRFDSNGALSASLMAPQTLPLTVNFPVYPATGARETIPIKLGFNGSTQYGADTSEKKTTQDGYTAGHLQRFSAGQDGILLGQYSNGQTKPLGQIVLANFTNPNGLEPLGNNAWAETSSSGNPVVGAPDTGSMGVLQSSATESSNVDLTAELVNMITAQRVYQANAQTIKTQDSVLQTLVNLR